MKKVFFLLLLATIITAPFLSTREAGAYSNNNLIDDAVFDNSVGMGAIDIQNFLNLDRFPNSCLKNYSSSYPNDYFSYSGVVSAATIIRRAADLWGLNPKVILAKLQQEESLVKGDAGCSAWRLNSAMGYNCPDSTGCDPRYAGFSQQVTKGSFQLKFNKEVSTGNPNWQENGNIAYGGYMTQGYRQRCLSCVPLSYRDSIYYDGYATIDGYSVHMDTGATASIYSYTPHVPSSFSAVYEDLFGQGSTSAYPLGYVYRLYRPSNDEHLYTASISEIESSKKLGFVYEGPAWPNTPAQGGSPVFRLYSKYSNRHMYTINDYEKNQAVSSLGYSLEGPSWYAFTSQVPGGTPVYRLYRRRDDKHLFTASLEENNNAISKLGFVSEGIAWYGK